MANVAAAHRPTTAPPALVVRLCSDPALLGVDGARVALGRKTFALLAFLCLEPGPHPRHRLATLLWPGSDEAHAAMSLRQAVARLREQVGDALHSDRQSVWIDRRGAPWQCDIDTIGAADVGAFLLPNPVDDAPDFLHWADRTRATLVRDAVDALRRATHDAAARRDWAHVAHAADRWIALEPLTEEATAFAMEAALMRGDPARARALMHAHRSATSDLAVSGRPGKRLTELLDRLEAVGSLTPAHGTPAASAPSSPAPAVRIDAISGTLQEREAMWNAATAAWTDLVAGRSTALLLESVPGGGRTRAIADVTAWAVYGGATALSAASPGAPLRLPYATLASLVRGAIDTPALAGLTGAHLRTLSQLVPEVAARFPALRSPAGASADASGSEPSFAWRLHAALDALLHTLCEDGPVVIAIDDVVWCDRESASLLQQLAVRCEALPVLWVLSAPDGARAEGANTVWQGLAAVHPPLALAPLTPAAIEALLVEWSGTGGWATFAARVHAVTGGIPALVTATVDDAVRDCTGDRVALQSMSPPVPRPHARTRAQVDALAELDRELLFLLAIAGERAGADTIGEWNERAVVSLDVLSHVHGISRLRAARVGGALADIGVVVEATHGFRAASPAVASYAITTGSRHVGDELRRRLRGQGSFAAG